MTKVMSVSSYEHQIISLDQNMGIRGKKKSVSRFVLSEDDNKDETPLSQLVNFGPVTRPELEAIGVRTLGEMRKIGWEDVCRRWSENFPERLNVNAFIGVIATIEGIVWTKITDGQRAQATRLVNNLRSELNLPPTRVVKRKVRAK
jgi:hypothetical protein